MTFLKSGKTGVIAFPWGSVTAGHVLEALDRTDEIPILIPSIHMYRVEGKMITKSTWMAIRIVEPKAAAL